MVLTFWPTLWGIGKTRFNFSYLGLTCLAAVSLAQHKYTMPTIKTNSDVKLQV